MRRLRAIDRSADSAPRLELMPLLDVVFLLLTFFAFAMLLMVQATVIDVRLPVVDRSGASSQPQDPRVISLAADGTLALDAEAISIDELLAELQSSGGDRDQRPVLLEVDAQADSGEMIRLVQRLRSAGISDFGVLGLPEAEGL
ncbi:MAG: biopolymer transporter ExbD [Planctomycetota bacterium]